MKSPLYSKTLWANFLMSGLAFFPGISDKFSVEQVMLLMGVINMVLRLVTKDKIGLE